MNRSRIVACVALGAAAMLGYTSAGWASPDEPLTVVTTDVSSYPDVRMVVAVPARLGGQTLTAAAFTVTEGGQSRTPTVTALAADQLEVALVIDTSGSTASAPLAAAKLALAFLAELPPTVPVSVVGFGASPTLVSPRSTDRPLQVAAIKAFGAGGQSALYDALGMALTQVPAAGAHQVAVLLSDGGDTASTASLDATAAAFAAAHVPLYAVELHASESSQGALARLTATSGGRVMTAADPAAVADTLDAFAQQLGRQYAVTYSSAGHGGTDIDLVVQANGVRATARTHLDLPAAPAPAPSATVDPAPTQPAATQPAATVDPAATQPAATRPAGSSPVVGGWALVVGSGLCGIALLGLLLGYASSRTPRARGLAARRRGIGMATVTNRAESVGDALLKRQGGVSAVSAVLELAGVDIRPGELLLGVTAGAVLLFAAGWFLVSPLLGLGLGLMVPLVARVGLRFLAARRRAKFTDQMAETLQILAGTLRAGHGLAQAIDTVAREAESPTAEEFRRLTIETRLGRDFVDALGALAERVGSEDFEWVVQAVQIQREVGGDLASILDTVASTVRDRTRIRRQVSALSAEGRMSAWVLMLLPFGLGGMMAITNPTYLHPLFSSGTGFRLLAVGAVLLAVGGAWLRRIVKPIF